MKGDFNLEKLEIFFHLLYKIVKYLVVTIAVALTITVLLQVFTRYVIFYSLPWTEELARYLLVWLTMLGGAVAYRQRAHIGVSFFVNLLPEKGIKFVRLISSLLVMLFSIYVIRFGIEFVFSTARQLSPAMRISMSYVSSSIPVGLTLLIIFGVENFLKSLGLLEIELEKTTLTETELD